MGSAKVILLILTITLVQLTLASAIDDLHDHEQRASELHERLKANPQMQQKLTEFHERLNANPVMRQKLTELHERLKANPMIEHSVAERIKERMSERKAELDSRAQADCMNDLRDMGNQTRTLLDIAMRIRQSGMTVRLDIARCNSGGSGNTACMENAIEQVMGELRTLGTEARQAMTNIQVDLSRLRSCMASSSSSSSSSS